MPGLTDQLVAWRLNPDAASTLVLAERIEGHEHLAAARELAVLSQSRFSGDVRVMRAVGKMLVRVGLFAEAQTALTLAGRAAPTEASIFVDLGHVLLRRGDAIRAGKAWRRAADLGSEAPELARWRAAAEALGESQTTRGLEAVASEVESLELGDDPPAAAQQVGGMRVTTVAEAAEISEVVAPSAPQREPEARPSPPQGTVVQLGLWGPSSRDSEWVVLSRGVPVHVWVLTAATVMSLLTILVAAALTARERSSRWEQAEVLADSVRYRHSSGRPEELGLAAGELRRMFALAPRNPTAAGLWLENRALATLWEPVPPPGLTDALRRAERARIEMSELAGGRVLARLAAGDLEGAEQLEASLASIADDRALYHLSAGYLSDLEGLPDAMLHYERARALAPDQAIVHVLQARLSLLEDGASPGAATGPPPVPKLADHPIGRVMHRLAWALDPQRPAESPVPQLSDAERAALPQPLRAMPYLIAAVQALERAERARAVEALEAALTRVVTPAAMTRLGRLALVSGDPELARRVAWRVHERAPGYRHLAPLAARVGLFGGRITEAKRVILSLGVASDQVGIIHAIAAYERSDAGLLASALGVLAGKPQLDSELAALPLLGPVLLGTQQPDADALQDLATPGALWGDLVAIDSALDSGKLDLAQSMVRGWGGRYQSLPPFATRRARLARYSGEPTRAVQWARMATDQGEPTPRAVIELVLAQLELGQAPEARQEVARNDEALGPFAPWLSVLVTRAVENDAVARLEAAALRLPEASSPLSLRTLALLALAESGEARSLDLLQHISRTHAAHPDVVRAAARVHP